MTGGVVQDGFHRALLDGAVTGLAIVERIARLRTETASPRRTLVWPGAGAGPVRGGPCLSRRGGHRLPACSRGHDRRSSQSRVWLKAIRTEPLADRAALARWTTSSIGRPAASCGDGSRDAYSQDLGTRWRGSSVPVVPAVSARASASSAT